MVTILQLTFEHTREKTTGTGENKGAERDQYLCSTCSTILLLPIKMQNLKLLVYFCDCSGQFVWEPCRKPRLLVFSYEGSFLYLYKLLLLFNNIFIFVNLFSQFLHFFIPSLTLSVILMTGRGFGWSRLST